MIKKKPISFSLGDREIIKVERLARAEGLTRSEMIRLMIKNKRAPKKSRLARRKTFLTGDAYG